MNHLRRGAEHEVVVVSVSLVCALSLVSRISCHRVFAVELSLWRVSSLGRLAFLHVGPTWVVLMVWVFWSLH